LWRNSKLWDICEQNMYLELKNVSQVLEKSTQCAQPAWSAVGV